MSEPLSPPTGAAPASYPSTPAPQWQQSWDAPSWTAPSWTEPAWAPPAAPPIAAPAPRRGLGLALVGVGGVLIGAVGAAFVAGAVVRSNAEDVGREMASGLREEIRTAVDEQMTESFGESMDVFGAPTGPVDQSPPVAPVPGADPVLDTYAQNCFAGDLQSCDDLYYEAPPLSDYEEYAVTCGGRVKAYAVMYCIDLD